MGLQTKKSGTLVKDKLMAKISKVAMNIAKEATGQSQGKIMQSIAPSTGDIQLTMAGEPGHELTPEQVLQLLEMTRIALSQLHKKQFLLAQEEPPKTMVHAIADQRGLQMNAVAENFAEYIVIHYLGERVIFFPAFNIQKMLIDNQQKIILNILREIKDNCRNSSFKPGELVVLVDKSLRQIQRILDAIIETDLQNIFKAVRMANAIAQLKKGKKSNQAADSAGFSSHPYFSRIFREAFGMTPSDFQKRFIKISESGNSASEYAIEKSSPDAWQASSNALESSIQGIRSIAFGNQKIDLLEKFVISPLLATSNIDTVLQVIGMIRKNFENPDFSSVDITTALNIEDWRLHIRMQNMRLSFDALLFALRMQEASKMLQSGQDTSNIISMIGYQDANNLRADYEKCRSLLFNRLSDRGNQMEKAMRLFIDAVTGKNRGS